MSILLHYHTLCWECPFLSTRYCDGYISLQWVVICLVHHVIVTVSVIYDIQCVCLCFISVMKYESFRLSKKLFTKQYVLYVRATARARLPRCKCTKMSIELYTAHGGLVPCGWSSLTSNRPGRTSSISSFLHPCAVRQLGNAACGPGSPTASSPPRTASHSTASSDFIFLGPINFLLEMAFPL